MNKYEGLFILDAAVKEEVLKETIDRIEKDIKQSGGRVETVQKMGQRALARVNAKRSAGFYVNIIFDAPPKAVAELDAKLHLATDVIRWQFTRWIPEPERKPRRGPKAEAALAAAKEAASPRRY